MRSTVGGMVDPMKPRVKDRVLGLVLILPLALWVFSFFIYPIMSTIWLSLHDQGVVGTGGPFVGLGVYRRLLLDPEVHAAFARSVIWTVGNGVVQGGLGFLAALLLNTRFRGQSLLRMWVIFPWIVPTVVIAIIWKWMLSATFGVINYLLQLCHFTRGPLVFIGSPDNTMWTIIGINSWRWFPFLTVVLLAALQNIPRELYEAARVDGATSPQSFRFVTLPLLRPTMGLMGLMGVLLSFNLFDVIWLLTQGGPADTTTTLPVLIYRKAFKVFRISEASALSMLMLVFLALLCVVLRRLGADEDA